MAFIIAGCSRDKAALTNQGASPVIRSLSVQGLPVHPGNSAVATVIAISPQGLPLLYTWAVSNGWAVSSGRNSTTSTITAPDSYGSNGRVTVTVSDTLGRHVTGTTSLSTEGSNTPVIRSILLLPGNPLLPDPPNPVLPDGKITAIVDAFDPNGYALNYAWAVSPDWGVTGYGPTATIAAPSAYGTGGAITVTVNNGQGGTASGSLAMSTQDYSPSFIVFVSARDGDYSIYRMKQDGTAVSRLSNPSTGCVLRQCFDTYPAACKNSIVFSSNRTGRFQIYAMSVDGNYLTEITHNANADADAPDLSYDCTIMTYTQAIGYGRQLQIMNTTTGSVTRLTYDDGSGACCGKFSPDGKTIAFIHDPFPGASPLPSTEPSLSIYLISADGSNRHSLCNLSNVLPPLSWSADGKFILFLMPSPTTGHLEIFFMPVDCSTSPVPLTSGSYDVFDPAFSPDGSKIAYTSTEFGNSRIFLMNSDGTNSFDLTNDVHLNDQPAWQKSIPLP